MILCDFVTRSLTSFRQDTREDACYLECVTNRKQQLSLALSEQYEAFVIAKQPTEGLISSLESVLSADYRTLR